MREKSVDFITPQVYRRTAADYEAELDRQIAALPDTSRLVPGIDISNSRDPDVLVRMIEITRAKALPGAVIWYYTDLLNTGAFRRLKETVYAEPADLPWRH